MKFFNKIAISSCIALAGLTLAPLVIADETDRRTILTFTQPVEIPQEHIADMGVLPPGTYVFKVLNSQQNRHIVQIFNADESKIYATVMAIPKIRTGNADDTEITFYERPEGKPQAIRSWFYPARSYGEEFLYPADKNVQVTTAAPAPQPVVAEPLPVAAVTPAPAPKPVFVPREEPVVIAQNTPAPVSEPTPVVAEPAPVAAPAPMMAMNNELPKTAGNLPLIGLLGSLALAAGLLIRGLETKQKDV